MKWLGLIIGSALGGVSRYLVAGAVVRVLGTRFPYGTFVVNLVGCFLIGFLFLVLGNKFPADSSVRLFLITGFCGAFTTFSTFAFEISQLIQSGEFTRAVVYVVASVVLGLALFQLGMLSARLVP